LELPEVCWQKQTRQEKISHGAQGAAQDNRVHPHRTRSGGVAGSAHVRPDRRKCIAVAAMASATPPMRNNAARAV
jgi:hypothetical protein